MKKLIATAFLVLMSFGCFATDYIVTYEIRQKHYNLDFIESIKDKKNAMRFSLPTTKEFYDSLEIGDNIVDKFRKGSFWWSDNWSVGKQLITVVDKQIK